jgi:hypothetical protein
MIKTKSNGSGLRAKKTPPPGATYSVGYARPPEHGKFKKGETGNPRGRPRNSRNRRTTLKEILEEKVEATVGGKRVVITKYECGKRIQVNKMLQGNDRSYLIIENEVEQQGLFEEGPPQHGVLVLPAPMGPEEYLKLYGKAARGTPVPPDIVERLEKLTKKKLG